MKNKILKVIQVIYDILSLGFIVFVIVAMAVTPKSEGHHDNNVTEVVEKKSRDNMLLNYGWGIASVYEIFSRSELYNGFSDSFYNATQQGFTFSMPYMTSDTYYIKWDLIDKNNPDHSVINNGIPLTSAYFQLSAYGENGFNRYQSWELNLVFNNSDIFRFTCEIMYSNSSTDKSIIGVDIVQREIVPSGGYSSSFFIAFRSSSYLYNLFNEPSYEQGYGIGYETGYDKGYDDGNSEGYNKAVIDVLNPDSTQYQYIYDLGKQEGIVEGMRGTESNAFIVIGQAFSAVGSIFSIEVLPNLPLWVLVFTPLIIVVVIVVVKLIKG